MQADFHLSQIPGMADSRNCSHSTLQAQSVSEERAESEESALEGRRQGASLGHCVPCGHQDPLRSFK